jgi:hypothetical protein
VRWLSCFLHARTSIRGRIFLSARIRSGPRFKRFPCFVLIDLRCFRLPPKMYWRTRGLRPVIYITSSENGFLTNVLSGSCSRICVFFKLYLQKKGASHITWHQSWTKSKELQLARNGETTQKWMPSVPKPRYVIQHEEKIDRYRWGG